jgi:hypothetical protein
MRFLSAGFLLCVLSVFVAAEDLPEFSPRSWPSNLLLESPLQASPRPLSTKQIVQNSALIFSGTVLTVEHLGTGPSGSQGITRIRFRVQNGVRGARPGQIVQIREWAGLWSAGECYRPGESVMLFLYPNSKLGLTSPVGGAAGRFHVDKLGRVQIGREHDFVRSGAVSKPNINVRDFAAAIRRSTRE